MYLFLFDIIMQKAKMPDILAALIYASVCEI